jgi:catechol 2,3-dioxygenase-like lactoylglutathione lyase family enzyme
MLTASPPVCFILTADMAKARGFYRDTLGLTETGEDPFAISYDLAGTMLRLTQVEGHQPGPHTVLGWMVKRYRDDHRCARRQGRDFRDLRGLRAGCAGYMDRSRLRHADCVVS